MTDTEKTVTFDELWEQVQERFPDKEAFRMSLMIKYLSAPCLFMRFNITDKGQDFQGLVLDMKKFSEELSSHGQEN